MDYPGFDLHILSYAMAIYANVTLPASMYGRLPQTNRDKISEQAPTGLLQFLEQA